MRFMRSLRFFIELYLVASSSEETVPKSTPSEGLYILETAIDGREEFSAGDGRLLGALLPAV